MASPDVAAPEIEVSELDESLELEVSQLESSRAAPSEIVAPEVVAPSVVVASVVAAPEPTAPEPTLPVETTRPAAIAPPLAAITRASARPSAMQMDATPLPAAAPELASVADEPVPSSERHAFSLPPTPVVPAVAHTGLSSGRTVRAGPGRWLRHKVSLGVLGATLGVGVALAVDSALTPPSADADAPVAAALPALPAAAAEAPAAPVAATELPAAPVAAAPLAELRAAAAPPAADSHPLPSGTPSDSAPAGAQLQPMEAGAGATAESADSVASGLGDLHVEALGDGQLVAAFALERRRDVPACSEKLGADAAGYTGDQPQPSRAHFKAARRALQRGKLETAYTELCIATAHDLDNVEAQRSLAELALDMGDPARAKEAAERGLARAPNNVELLGVLGDALAMLGQIPESRRVWLETDTKSPEAQRPQRLAASYQKAGERSLSSFNFPRARSYFRRSLILTEGGHEAALGLGDALLWLDQAPAGLVWAERVARALPASARAQILLGDAYAKSGELDSARAAWKAARRTEPGNLIAARRLSRGPR
jgi:tetratricopeptide (TPR) repeat protein